MTEKTKAPIWLVAHPTYRYAEDVKALARKAGLRVVDADFASSAERADAVSAKDAPKLTLKPEYAPAKADAKKE